MMQTRHPPENPDDRTSDEAPAPMEGAQFRAVIDSLPQGLVILDPESQMVYWNPAARAMYGFVSTEAVKRTLQALPGIFEVSTLEGAVLELEDWPLTRLLRGESIDPIRLRVRRWESDSCRVFQYHGARVSCAGNRSLVVLAMDDITQQRIAEEAQDVARRQRQERELARISRLYAALGQVNQAITRTAEQVELFQRVCRALVDEGGFAMASIGWQLPGEPNITLQAAWGGSTDSVSFYTDLRIGGSGPFGAALREGRPYVSNDLDKEPDTVPWRDGCLRNGLHASAALPIRQNGSARGILCVCSHEQDVFQDKEMSLLMEAASEISYALDNTAQAKAREKAQEAARQERMFSSALIESMPGIFYFVDEEGRFLRWNQNFLSVSGYSADEMAKLRSSEFLTDEQRAHAGEVTREVFERGEASFEGDLRCKDGGTAPYLFTGKRVDVDGIVGLVGMGVDISARTRAEAEVRRLNAELEARVVERTAQLEAANRDLEAFSYSVSHDLRAPLRSVNGYAEIVLSDFAADLPEEARRLLQRIRSRGLHMGVLIDDLLEFSRLGRKPLSRREVDMRSLVEGIIQGLGPQWEGRRIEFNVGDVPPCQGDPSLLRQVWVNLLSNAIKYSRGREPAIIDVGSRVERGGSVYFVRDNGVGFDMQFEQKLFGVFQRLHLADEFEGTGVGLAIVRRIVERHGGRTWAVGQEQQGATFYFSMPVSQGTT